MNEPLRYPFGKLSSDHQVDLVIYTLLCTGIIALMAAFTHFSFYPCSVLLSNSRDQPNELYACI